MKKVLAIEQLNNTNSIMVKGMSLDVVKQMLIDGRVIDVPDFASWWFIKR